MPLRSLASIEDFSGGLVSSMAPENVPSTASPSARNLNLRDRGEASLLTGFVPIENIGIAGRILFTGDFHPTADERFSPSVIVPDTTNSALFDLDNRWVDLNTSQITLKNGFVLRVATGTIAAAATADVVQRSTDGGLTFSSSATLTNGTGESQTINGGVLLQLQDGRVISNVNLSGATVNIVDTQATDNNGGTWAAQTHPNTSVAAPAEELLTFYYQIRGGSNGGRLIINFVRSAATEVQFSDDRGGSFTAATTDPPGGTTAQNQAYEAESGQELTTTFGAVTAGTVYFRENVASPTIFRSVNAAVDWNTTTEINFPYGLFFAELDREGLPGGVKIGQNFVVGDGRARTVLFNGHSATPLGVARPLTAPSTGTTGTGRTGTYEASYTYYDSRTRQESAPSDTTEQILTNQNITITPTASTESQVDRIRFYLKRTDAGNLFATAYLAGEAGNVAAAFTVADSDLTILGRAIPVDEAVGGTIVSSRRIFEQHQSRLVMAADVEYNTGSVSVTNGSAAVTGSGTAWHVGMENKFFQRDGDTTRYLITSVANATSLTLFTDYQGDTNANAGYNIAIDPSEVVFSRVLRPWIIKSAQNQLMFLRFPSAVTGLKSYSEDILLVFTEDNVWAITGMLSDSPTFERTILIRDAGAISSKSIIQVQDTVYWISKSGFESWSRNKGYVRLSDGRVADRFDGQLFGERFSFCVNDPVAEEIMIFTTTLAASLAPDTRLRYFYKSDRWMSGEFNGFATAATIARTAGDLPEVRIVYYDETNSRPMVVSRTIYAEGIGTGTLSGNVSSATSGDPITLTIAAGALETTNDALTGRFLAVVRTSGTNAGTFQSIRIASNTTTVITGEAGVAWPLFTPQLDDRWSIGAIESQWQTPDLVMGTQDGLHVQEVQMAFEIV